VCEINKYAIFYNIQDLGFKRPMWHLKITQGHWY